METILFTKYLWFLPRGKLKYYLCDRLTLLRRGSCDFTNKGGLEGTSA